jgi:predicted aldo/keto reductase-like oxidoreductase
MVGRMGGDGDWLEAVDKLKRDGKIRFFGLSIHDHQPANAIKMIETGVVDTVQVIYTIFDQSRRMPCSPRARNTMSASLSACRSTGAA